MMGLEIWLGNSKNPSLTYGHIFVGKWLNAAADVAMSNDATMTNTGALTLATVNASPSTYNYATITVNGKGLVTSASSGTAPTTYTADETTLHLSGGQFNLIVPVVVGKGGTGTTTALTLGSIVTAGASGVYTEDNANLFYTPNLGPSSGPSLQVGPRGTNPLDARVEIYHSGTNCLHLHSTAAQSTTSGAGVTVYEMPGAALTSGNRLGVVQFGGMYDTNYSHISIGNRIDGYATETWSSTANGSQLKFFTTPNTTLTPTLALTLGQDQTATFAGTINTPLTASRVLTTDASSNIAASSITTTTLGYLDASSSIQTQLNGKQATIGYTPANIAGDTFTGTVTINPNNESIDSWRS